MSSKLPASCHGCHGLRPGWYEAIGPPLAKPRRRSRRGPLQGWPAARPNAGANTEDLVPALRALAAKDLWQNAVEFFFEEAASRKANLPEGALNATLNACQRAGQWEACFALLQHSLRTRRSSLDVISFNSSINACQEGAAWLRALQLLQLMERERILANDISYSSCISVCGSAAQWQRSLSLLHRKPGSVVSLGAALDACAKGEAWQEALCLYQLMQHGDTKPNVICGNAVLNAFSKALQWRLALVLLQEMPKTTVISFNSVLSALHHSWPQSLALLLQMRDMSIVNAASYNTCIASMGAALQWPRALLLFEGTGSSGALLGALGQASAWRHALRILRGLKAPDLLCYNATMRACERAHEWQRAMLIFHQIQVKCRSSASYCSACSALSRQKHWQQSLQLLCTATASNLASRPLMGAAIFGAASGAAWQVAVAIFASMRSAQVEPDDSTRHSLLSVLPAEQATAVLRGKHKKN